MSATVVPWPDYPLARHAFIQGDHWAHGTYHCARCRLLAQGPGTMHDHEPSEPVVP